MRGYMSDNGMMMAYPMGGRGGGYNRGGRGGSWSRGGGRDNYYYGGPMVMMPMHDYNNYNGPMNGGYRRGGGGNYRRGGRGRGRGGYEGKPRNKRGESMPKNGEVNGVAHIENTTTETAA